MAVSSNNTALWRNGKLPFLAALIGFLIFHLFQAGSVPLGHDEAFYTLWSSSWQWGYYDHPPMIALWIALGEPLVASPMAIRLTTVLAHSATSFALYALLREIGADKPIARGGAIAYQAILLCLTDGFLAVPDAPATLFWTTTLLLTARAANTGNLLWWLAAGFSAGLLALSKYTGFLLAPGLVTWLALRHRNSLRSFGPYLAAFTALCVFAPNLWWNANNDWVAFASQFGRILPSDFSDRFWWNAENDWATTNIDQIPAWARSLGVLVVLFVLLNPALLFALTCAHRKTNSQMNCRIRRADTSSLILSSLPLALTYFVLAVTSVVHLHWIRPVLPAMAGLAAIAICRLQPHRKTAFWAWLLIFDGLYMTGVYVMPVNFIEKYRRFLSGIDGGQKEFAEKIRQKAHASNAGWIGIPHYAPASLLSATAEPNDTPVIQLIERRRYPLNHPSWRTDLDKPGLILLSRTGAYGTKIHQFGGVVIDPNDLNACFGSVVRQNPIMRMHGHIFEYYDVYLVSEPKRDIRLYGCSLPSYTPSLGGARYLRIKPPNLPWPETPEHHNASRQKEPVQSTDTTNQ